MGDDAGGGDRCRSELGKGGAAAFRDGGDELMHEMRVGSAEPREDIDRSAGGHGPAGSTVIGRSAKSYTDISAGAQGQTFDCSHIERPSGLMNLDGIVVP